MEDIRFKVNSKELDGSTTTADMTISNENEVSAEVSSEGGGSSSTSFSKKDKVIILDAHSENEILDFFNNQDIEYVRDFLFQIQEGSDTDYFKTMYETFSKLKFHITFKKNLKILDENNEYHNLSDFCENPLENEGIYVMPDTNYDTMYCLGTPMSNFMVNSNDDSNGSFGFSICVCNPKDTIKELHINFIIELSIINDSIQSSIYLYPDLYIIDQDENENVYYFDNLTTDFSWNNVVDEFVLHL